MAASDFETSGFAEMILSTAGGITDFESSGNSEIDIPLPSGGGGEVSLFAYVS